MVVELWVLVRVVWGGQWQGSLVGVALGPTPLPAQDQGGVQLWGGGFGQRQQQQQAAVDGLQLPALQLHCLPSRAPPPVLSCSPAAPHREACREHPQQAAVAQWQQISQAHKPTVP